MPITKKRPHVAELLNIAVEQRRKLRETREEMLHRPASIWIPRYAQEMLESGSGRSLSQNVLLLSKSLPWNVKLTILSRLCERVVTDKYVQILKTCLWTLGFAILAYLVTKDLSTSPFDIGIIWTDFSLNILLLVFSIIKLCGLHIRIKIESLFNREMDMFETIVECGILEIIVTAVCLAVGLSNIGLWSRLLRLGLLLSPVLELFPHLNVLMNSMGNGMKSIFFTILVLFLLVLSYGLLGYQFFSRNDPFHFGTYALSVLTFFQLSTFENWSVIFYINYSGCNSFPSEYPPPSSFNQSSLPSPIATIFGTFELPICTNSQAQPLLASLIFCSYAFVAGYVIVSMCLAAVALGINEKLDDLRTISLYGEDDDDDAFNIHSTHNAAGQGSKASKLLGNSGEIKSLKELLKKIWLNQGVGTVDGLFKSSQSSFKVDSLCSATSISGEATTIIRHIYYKILITLAIVADAVLRIVSYSTDTVSPEDSPEMVSIHVLFQCILLVDAIFHLLSRATKPRQILRDYWTIFDLTVVVVLFLPSLMPFDHRFYWLSFLSIFRLIRVLKRLSFLIPDLGAVLDALANSSTGVMYVAILVLIFFMFFGIAGTLLFKEAAPYYFSNPGIASRTLLQVMTMDNWSDIMRKCMIGCKYYGFSTGYQSYDSSCDFNNGRGVGYWAALYFVLFVILSAMVLTSLLVGVIITSLELLREDTKASEEMWKKVKMVAKRYNISKSSTDMLLELFDKLDKSCNGVLTFVELKPILDIVNMNNDRQFAFFMKIDIDKSGQIDFAEFCEMISFMGNEPPESLLAGHFQRRNAHPSINVHRPNQSSQSTIDITNSSQTKSIPRIAPVFRLSRSRSLLSAHQTNAILTVSSIDDLKSTSTSKGQITNTDEIVSSLRSVKSRASARSHNSSTRVTPSMEFHESMSFNHYNVPHGSSSHSLNNSDRIGNGVHSALPYMIPTAVTATRTFSAASASNISENAELALFVVENLEDGDEYANSNKGSMKSPLSVNFASADEKFYQDDPVADQNIEIITAKYFSLSPKSSEKKISPEQERHRKSEGFGWYMNQYSFREESAGNEIENL